MNVYNRIEQFRKKIVLNIFKKYLMSWLEIRHKKKIKVKMFRNTLLKIKVFKFFLKYKFLSKQIDDKKVKKFRTSFLKYNFFVLLFKFRLVQYRENKILERLSKMYKSKRKKLIKKAIKFWKLFYICEKFRKMKMIRKIARIFYAMKLMLN